MAIKAIFKSQLPSFSYHFKNGMTAVFIFGRYETEDMALIEELTQEIGAVGTTKSKHPYIFIDENEYQLDTEALSPMELIRQKARQEARAELLAEQAAERQRAMNPSLNTSTSTQGNFVESLANSNNIAQVNSNPDINFVKVSAVPTPANNGTVLPAGVGPAEGVASVDQTQFDPIVKEILDAPIAEVVNTPPAESSMAARLAALKLNKEA